MNSKQLKYQEFLRNKIITTDYYGFDTTIYPELSENKLKPHQHDILNWSIKGGRRAIFAQFGLGKTVLQLMIAKYVRRHTGKPFLIGLPLAVTDEFIEDSRFLGLEVTYVKDMDDILKHQHTTKISNAIYMSNYERIREGKFDASFFGGVSFDEGDAIRNLDTQTTDYIMKEFSVVPFRFIATATPSPNDYTEILNYAQFLGIMDRSQALTRFFQRDSTKAGNLTLYPHKVKEFWFWVRSWAIVIQKPSDLGYSDEGYDMPPMEIKYHMVTVKDRGDIIDRDGNLKMFRDTSKSLVDVSKEKRESLPARVKKAMEIVKSDTSDDHWLIWHHLEDERKAIEKELPEVKSVFGSQNWEQREDAMKGFKAGKYKYLSTKPEIAGAGCNFQKHCHKAVFVGIDFKFKDFIQAVHRILRYLQNNKVELHIVYSDAEEAVLKTLLRKWNDHNNMVYNMSELIKEFGLSQSAMHEELLRTIGVDRKEEVGKTWKLIHNDAVMESMEMEENSIDMIMTSIPFSDQYEYCESYHDMGHNDGNDEFFKQMDFLTPELLRITKPGRIAAIHVKDRIQFSYQNGVGFTSLIDFSGITVAHFIKHGWFLLGKHIITTDVVRENNQTYRLGWSEQCKDGTKMGCGSPEYLLIFRKAPTEMSNSYADEPVRKTKQEYTRARWQLDAHAYWKSSGDRLLDPNELRQMDLSKIGKAWEAIDRNNTYDFDYHVGVCEALESVGKLPAQFMAVPPRSTTDSVWDDINRMSTLNTSQTLRKKEKHVCPLQFDIIDRAITRYSNENDLIYDPFGGIGSVPYRCQTLNRNSIATELNPLYWKDAVMYNREAEMIKNVPTLFNIA